MYCFYTSRFVYLFLARSIHKDEKCTQMVPFNQNMTHDLGTAVDQVIVTGVPAAATGDAGWRAGAARVGGLRRVPRGGLGTGPPHATFRRTLDHEPPLLRAVPSHGWCLQPPVPLLLPRHVHGRPSRLPLALVHFLTY